jgi:predicted O-methyltransferase YrrM
MLARPPAYREDFGWRSHSIFGALGLRPPVAQHSIPERDLIRRAAAGARSIVEIGVAEGGSAYDMREVMDPAGCITLIEPFPRVAGLNISRFTAYRLVESVDRGRVTWIRALSHEAVDRWSGEIDVLLIDGDHSYEATKRDFEDWSAHMAQTGTILFHDALLDAPWMDEGFGSARFVAELRASDSPWKLADSADSLAAFRRA